MHDPVERAVIVGLGNPGQEYSRTRHNVGYRVLEELCRRTRTRLSPGKGDYYIGQTANGMLLIAPTTYMNNSGIAVADVVERYGLMLEQMLIVVDDFALPLGTVRYRQRGSDGGHNGLASIIMSLKSDAFPRLRCGIGQTEAPRGASMADFVLTPFASAEEPVVADMVRRPADAAEQFAVNGYATPVNPPRDASERPAEDVQ